MELRFHGAVSEFRRMEFRFHATEPANRGTEFEFRPVEFEFHGVEPGSYAVERRHFWVELPSGHGRERTVAAALRAGTSDERDW